MKKPLFYLLLFIAPFLAFSQSKRIKITDLKESGLKGKVATFKETKYSVKNWKGVDIKDTITETPKLLKYNTKGYIIEEINYETDGSIFDKWIYAYDKNNNQLEGKRYSKNGHLIWNYLCKYDTKNNQIEIVKYEEGSLIETTKLKYDANGNCIEISSESDGTWKETFSYDVKGNKTESISYNPDGKINSRETYKYDSKGKVIEKLKYGTDESFMGKETYKYDEKGNNTEYNYFSSSGNLIEKNICSYDNKGNQTEQNSYRADGTLTWRINFEYMFTDTKGNWTLKREIINGKDQSMTYRELSYF